MTRLRVYIAGPISKGDLAENINQAETAFFELLKAGLAPFCPHWSAYSTGPHQDKYGAVFAFAKVNGGGDATHADWMATDLAWVAAADALLRLPGESVGADQEVLKARELGIPVYTSVRDILAVEMKTMRPNHVDLAVAGGGFRHDAGQPEAEPAAPVIRSRAKPPATHGSATIAVAGSEFAVRDSGQRRDFGTGSVRDVRTGKGRFDLISPIALKRLAQHYENGAKKYGDRNWEKGQLLGSYLDSAIRHLFAWLEGDRVEDHLSAASWNCFAYVHTEAKIKAGELPAELNDMDTTS